MSYLRNKFNPVGQRTKSPKKSGPQVKPRSPLAQIKVIEQCNESIKQLEKLRTEKEELVKALPAKPIMNVWQRLSKAKRSLNENGEVIGNPYRHELCIKAGQEAYVYKPQVNHRLAAKRSPPELFGMKKEAHKLFHKRPFNFETCDNIQRNKSMTELMFPRQICDSSTSFEDITPKNSSKSMGSIHTEKSDDFKNPCVFLESSDNFESATSGIDIARESPSARIAKDFRTALERHCRSMSPEEINVIKNHIKTDKRLAKGTHSNEDIFCDILRSKLKEISKEEKIIRTALQNLGQANAKPLVSPKEVSKAYKKPQVHVILRNVPDSHREVAILRALGERLEKTLKEYPQVDVVKRSACTITREIHTARELHFLIGTLHYATGRVRVQAVCMHIAFVREFSIANKTINDLKNEKRQFYLPANDKHTELRRTSFKRLRENPKLLMSFLQCKNSLVPFNVLENDVMFLNSIFYDTNQNNTPSEKLSDDEDETVVISDPYETRRSFMNKEALKIEEIPVTSRTPFEKTHNIQETIIGDMPSNYAVKNLHFKENTSKVSYKDEFFVESEQDEKRYIVKPELEPTIESIPTQVLPPATGRRRRIRKYVAPLQERKYVSPKNKLFRFMILGIMQLGLFMALFASYVYPEITCINNIGLQKKNI